MKRISFILLSLFITYIQSSTVKCQDAPSLPMDEDTKLITYKDVVKEKGTAPEFYDRAILWVHKFYKNPTDVLREKDKDKGNMKCIARMQFYGETNGTKAVKGNVEYTLNLEFKDGRYRYTITGLNLKQQSYFPLERWLNTKDPAFNENINKYLTQVDAYINDLISSLEKGMEQVEKKKDEW